VLYYERWEEELAVDELKTHQRERPVLRSQAPAGVVQELHHPNAIGALRTTMVIPFRSTARRFIPHLSNRSWPEGQ
jgi:hypothetical protein